jgi:hypothetical protein
MGVFTTTPHDWTSGEIVTDVLLDEQLRGFQEGFGALSAHTPVITASGTAFAIGNGAVAGAYSQIQKWVRYRGKIVFGSTTTFGTGVYSISLPVAVSTAISNIPEWGCWIRDASAPADYFGFALNDTANTFTVRGVSGFGTSTLLGATVPVTLANGDWVSWDFWYPAA